MLPMSVHQPQARRQRQKMLREMAVKLKTEGKVFKAGTSFLSNYS